MERFPPRRADQAAGDIAGLHPRGGEGQGRRRRRRRTDAGHRLLPKCTLVWLDQLSKKYKKSIARLDQIPDEELDKLRERGFTALWLIGLWERSEASKRIKNLCGNPDAEASAYSLKDYEISSAIGGWQSLENLRERCRQRGIRLASDMVPNHTGIDGNWVYEHPDYFVQQDWPPYPSYTYNGPDLSTNPDYEVKIEDHYYDRTDAAVTFRLRNRHTGETRYIFHGNDGTSMPWNDTAQLDYLNPTTREAVIQKILHVARNFPIIRFDAAMTLAKRHIQRLWYPKPGHGGDIAGRARYAISDEEFVITIDRELDIACHYFIGGVVRDTFISVLFLYLICRHAQLHSFCIKVHVCYDYTVFIAIGVCELCCE